MSSRIETIDNLTSCYDELEALLDQLAPPDWEVQSLCPDWTVRGVITHLISIEQVLAGWLPTPDDGQPEGETMPLPHDLPRGIARPRMPSLRRTHALSATLLPCTPGGRHDD